MTSELVSRFRNLPGLYIGFRANFGMKGHWQFTESRAALVSKFVKGPMVMTWRTSKPRQFLMLSTRSWAWAIGLTAAAAAAPVASTRTAPECAHRHCAAAAWSDSAARDLALLTIANAANAPLRFYYGSDGGARPAAIVRDAGGGDYLLLEYGIGRGPGASVWLAVLRLTDRLELLRKVRLRIWLSPRNAAEYRYSIEKPFGGGLTLHLTRHFTGTDTSWRYPPPTQTISIPAE